jgi:hypothetical protein
MPATHSPCSRFRCVLSLIILIANTVAPLLTPNGRTLLDCRGQDAATRAVARVRVVSHVGTIQGFRALVGLAKGGGDAHLDLDLPMVLCSLPSSVHLVSSPFIEHRAVRPSPPLRC